MNFKKLQEHFNYAKLKSSPVLPRVYIYSLWGAPKFVFSRHLMVLIQPKKTILIKIVLRNNRKRILLNVKGPCKDFRDENLFETHKKIKIEPFTRLVKHFISTKLFRK